jgi:hypothetical protein
MIKIKILFFYEESWNMEVEYKFSINKSMMFSYFPSSAFQTPILSLLRFSTKKLLILLLILQIKL